MGRLTKAKRVYVPRPQQQQQLEQQRKQLQQKQLQHNAFPSDALWFDQLQGRAGGGHVAVAAAAAVQARGRRPPGTTWLLEVPSASRVNKETITSVGPLNTVPTRTKDGGRGEPSSSGGGGSVKEINGGAGNGGDITCVPAQKSGAAPPAQRDAARRQEGTGVPQAALLYHISLIPNGGGGGAGGGGDSGSNQRGRRRSSNEDPLDDKLSHVETRRDTATNIGDDGGVVRSAHSKQEHGGVGGPRVARATDRAAAASAAVHRPPLLQGGAPTASPYALQPTYNAQAPKQSVVKYSSKTQKPFKKQQQQQHHHHHQRQEQQGAVAPTGIGSPRQLSPSRLTSLRVQAAFQPLVMTLNSAGYSLDGSQALRTLHNTTPSPSAQRDGNVVVKEPSFSRGSRFASGTEYGLNSGMSTIAPWSAVKTGKGARTAQTSPPVPASLLQALDFDAASEVAADSDDAVSKKKKGSVLGEEDEKEKEKMIVVAHAENPPSSTLHDIKETHKTEVIGKQECHDHCGNYSNDLVLPSSFSCSCSVDGATENAESSAAACTPPTVSRENDNCRREETSHAVKTREAAAAEEEEEGKNTRNSKEEKGKEDNEVAGHTVDKTATVTPTVTPTETELWEEMPRAMMTMRPLCSESATPTPHFMALSSHTDANVIEAITTANAALLHSAPQADMGRGRSDTSPSSTRSNHKDAEKQMEDEQAAHALPRGDTPLVTQEVPCIAASAIATGGVACGVAVGSFAHRYNCEGDVTPSSAFSEAPAPACDEADLTDDASAQRTPPRQDGHSGTEIPLAPRQQSNDGGSAEFHQQRQSTRLQRVLEGGASLAKEAAAATQLQIEAPQRLSLDLAPTTQKLRAAKAVPTAINTTTSVKETSTAAPACRLDTPVSYPDFVPGRMHYEKVEAPVEEAVCIPSMEVITSDPSASASPSQSQSQTQQLLQYFEDRKRQLKQQKEKEGTKGERDTALRCEEKPHPQQSPSHYYHPQQQQQQLQQYYELQWQRQLEEHLPMHRRTHDMPALSPEPVIRAVSDEVWGTNSGSPAPSDPNSSKPPPVVGPVVGITRHTTAVPCVVAPSHVSTHAQTVVTPRPFMTALPPIHDDDDDVNAMREDDVHSVYPAQSPSLQYHHSWEARLEVLPSPLVRHPLPSMAVPPSPASLSPSADPYGAGTAAMSMKHKDLHGCHAAHHIHHRGNRIQDTEMEEEDGKTEKVGGTPLSGFQPPHHSQSNTMLQGGGASCDPRRARKEVGTSPSSGAAAGTTSAVDAASCHPRKSSAADASAAAGAGTRGFPTYAAVWETLPMVPPSSASSRRTSDSARSNPSSVPSSRLYANRRSGLSRRERYPPAFSPALSSSVAGSGGAGSGPAVAGRSLGTTPNCSRGNSDSGTTRRRTQERRESALPAASTRVTPRGHRISGGEGGGAPHSVFSDAAVMSAQTENTHPTRNLYRPWLPKQHQKQQQRSGGGGGAAPPYYNNYYNVSAYYQPSKQCSTHSGSHATPTRPPPPHQQQQQQQAQGNGTTPPQAGMLFRVPPAPLNYFTAFHLPSPRPSDTWDRYTPAPSDRVSKHECDAESVIAASPSPVPPHQEHRSHRISKAPAAVPPLTIQALQERGYFTDPQQQQQRPTGKIPRPAPALSPASKGLGQGGAHRGQLLPEAPQHQQAAASPQPVPPSPRFGATTVTAANMNRGVGTDTQLPLLSPLMYQQQQQQQRLTEVPRFTLRLPQLSAQEEVRYLPRRGRGWTGKYVASASPSSTTQYSGGMMFGLWARRSRGRAAAASHTTTTTTTAYEASPSIPSGGVVADSEYAHVRQRAKSRHKLFSRPSVPTTAVGEQLPPSSALSHPKLQQERRASPVSGDSGDHQPTHNSSRDDGYASGGGGGGLRESRRGRGGGRSRSTSKYSVSVQSCGRESRTQKKKTSLLSRLRRNKRS